MMKKLLPKLIIILIVIIAVGVSVYFYFQYQKNQKLLQNPTLAAAEETRLLLEKVSKIIELPAGENPTVATVSDKSKLSDQQFFANAQDGDKVLIYIKTSKAILYRPSTNKIVEVAPVNNSVISITPAVTKTATSSSSVTQESKTAKTVKIAIYNGTQTAGLAGSYEEKLMDKIENIEVVEKGNTEGDYTSNLVIDLTGKNSVIAKQIALVVEGETSELPEVETKPDADILVIVGE